MTKLFDHTQFHEPEAAKVLAGIEEKQIGPAVKKTRETALKRPTKQSLVLNVTLW